MSRSKLGRRYRCFQCDCAFFDLGKTDPVCPRCGCDQRKAPKKPTVSKAKSSVKKSEVRSLPGLDNDPDLETDMDGLEDVELDDGDLLDQGGVESIEDD